MVKYTNRAAVASRIRDVRYAARSGACIVAGNFLHELVALYPTLKASTVKALVKQVNACRTAPHFRKRRRGFRDGAPAPAAAAPTPTAPVATKTGTGRARRRRRRR